MARTFTAKSAADLAREAERLGLTIPLQDDLSPLNRPLAVAGRTLGNRWCVQPMEGCDGEPDGSPGPLTFRRYERFGSGGAKLIWGEACAVSDAARANPRQLWLHAGNLDAYRDLVDRCRAAHRRDNATDADLLIGLQLTHSGRYCHRHPVRATPDDALDRRANARGVPLISDDDLARLPGEYAAAATLARAAGFDFVDVKQCHRYLLSELLGATRREGRYGGSFENRTRLAREVFQAIAAAEPGLMLTTRINLFDGLPFRKADSGLGEPDAAPDDAPTGWGLSAADPLTPDLAEPLRWLAEMQRLGVALVNLTLGNPYAQPHVGRPFEYPPPDGYESPEHPLIGVDRHFRLAAEAQQALPTLPMVGTGYSYLQEFLPQAAAANVALGRIQLVGVGRASLSQPDWVRQLAATGKLDRKRVCRTFSYCTAIMRAKDHPLGQFPTGCPPFDKEAYGEIWKDVQALQVKR